MSPKLQDIAVLLVFALHACTAVDNASKAGTGLQPGQAEIPFANGRAGVFSWVADGREGVWLERIGGEWYYGRFGGPCIGIDTTIRIGFAGATNRIDRFSFVVVPGQPDRCPFTSLTRSAPPPEQAARRTGVNE